MKSLTLEKGSRWLRKQMAYFRLPGAHHPGALFHMLLVLSWMPSPMLHSWFLNPPAEPAKAIKRAVPFIPSALLNWLSVGVIHLPFKHAHPSAIHLEKMYSMNEGMCLQGWDGLVGLMGLLALSSAQPESGAGEQSGLQTSAAFGPGDSTPFSISQTPFLELCLWAALEGFLIPYSKQQTWVVVQ